MLALPTHVRPRARLAAARAALQSRTGTHRTLPGAPRDTCYGPILQMQNLRFTGSEAGTGTGRECRGTPDLGREATFSVGLRGALDPANG